MKRKFYRIAKKLNVVIVSYKTHAEIGMGGLQVYSIQYITSEGAEYTFDDSYFHLSGDAPKVLEMFEIEVTKRICKLKNLAR
jgi:hypothetical protein